MTVKDKILFSYKALNAEAYPNRKSILDALQDSPDAREVLLESNISNWPPDSIEQFSFVKSALKQHLKFENQNTWQYDDAVPVKTAFEKTPPHRFDNRSCL